MRHHMDLPRRVYSISVFIYSMLVPGTKQANAGAHSQHKLDAARRTPAFRSGALHLDALWRAGAAGRLLQLPVAALKAPRTLICKLRAAVPRSEDLEGGRIAKHPSVVALGFLVVATFFARAARHRRVAETRHRCPEGLRVPRAVNPSDRAFGALM